MPMPIGWNARAVITTCEVVAWKGSAWRIHKQKYAATDPGGSRLVSGRYHRGIDQYSEDRVWAALYLATQPEICLAELFRHITPELFPFLNNYRLSEIILDLNAIVDCRELAQMGLSPADLTDDVDYQLAQSLGEAAYVHGFEGLIAPSATGLGGNLILFPLNLKATSHLQVISSRDPRLRPV